MSQERRNFDKEFKLMTVELSKSRESIQELAKELGIRAELIYRWRPEYLEKPEGSFTGHGKPRHTPEEAEIARLKKQLRDVEMERDILKKGHQHLLQGRREIYRFIACQSSRFPVDKMCEVLKVSRSGYYSSLKGTVSKRAKENQELLSLIKQEHKKSRQRYGSPRISQALRANQVQVSRPRVARLMKQAQIKARMVKRFRVSTDSKHSFAVSANLLNRGFSPMTTGQAWVSDITYIRTLTGWLYLTVVLDLADRKVMLGLE